MKPFFASSRRAKAGLWVASAVLLLGVGGCVDTSAVTQLASTADAATQKFPALANDYYDSCVRYKTYRLALASPPSSDPEQAEAACDAQGNSAHELLGANAVLMGYFHALGEMADTKTDDLSQPLDGLGKSIGTTNLFTTAQVTAFQHLLGFVLQAGLNAPARKKHRARRARPERQCSARMRGARQRIAWRPEKPRFAG